MINLLFLLAITCLFFGCQTNYKIYQYKIENISVVKEIAFTGINCSEIEKKLFSLNSGESGYYRNVGNYKFNVFYVVGYNYQDIINTYWFKKDSLYYDSICKKYQITKGAIITVGKKSNEYFKLSELDNSFEPHDFGMKLALKFTDCDSNNINIEVIVLSYTISSARRSFFPNGMHFERTFLPLRFTPSIIDINLFLNELSIYLNNTPLLLNFDDIYENKNKNNFILINP